jgi:cytosine/adenosine deaminase-related metal-dependent hydrolase
VILRAAWVIPVTSPPVRDGFVHAENGRIVSVGPWPAPHLGGLVEDLGRVALLPGLVNPHAHLELSAYADRIPPGPFWPWITRLIELRSAPGELEREQHGVQEGGWELLRAGVTCVGDVSRRGIAWPVLKRLPLRKVCFIELLSLADHPPRDPDELRRAVDAVEEDDLLTVGISPHAPYTVPADHFRSAIALAERRGRPWCSHWCETPEEVGFLRGGANGIPAVLRSAMDRIGFTTPGCGSIAHLGRCAGRTYPGALVHMNYVEAEDCDRLAEAGHTVVFCPRAHRFFGHAAHPFERLREAGVPLAIGTDSRASNVALSPLGELCCLREALPEPPATDDLLRGVTIDAARALRLGERIGSLETGKLADLAAFPIAEGCDSPADELVRTRPAAAAVWVSGRRVL